MGRDWPRDIFEALKSLDIRQAAYVPDAGHARLIALCQDDPDMIAVPLTSEEEGVALLAGAWLGGDRGVLLMQSSGVGNCVNQFAFVQAAQIPLLCLVTMRGEADERNPWQVPMGQAAAPVMETMGFTVSRIDRAEQAGPGVTAAGEAAFRGDALAAVTIAQGLIGVKAFDSAGAPDSPSGEAA